MGAVTNFPGNEAGAPGYPRALPSATTLPSGSRRTPLAGAYVALFLFMFFYCARPEDWIPGLAAVPVAKIAGGLALLALIFSVKQLRSSLPREVIYLALLTGQLFLAAAVSPVWRGGAMSITLDFAKVLLIVIVMAVVVNTASRLRRLILIQAGSAALIAAVAVWKGHVILGRLEGALGAYYADPNDLALAITISLPLCLACLFLSRSRLRQSLWALAILLMLYTIFRTGSRGGLVALVVTAVVFLWEFAVKGKRRYLLGLAVVAGVLLWAFSGGVLAGRVKGTFNADANTAASYASAEARQELFWRSIAVTKAHPLFGVGPGNFEQVSGSWHVTHNAYTQMSAEAGLPALVLYALILWSGFKNLRQAKRFAQGRPELILCNRALCASLAGYAAGSFFLSDAYAFFPYFLVAYTTAALALAKKNALLAKLPKPVSSGEPEMQTWAPLPSAIGAAGWVR